MGASTLDSKALTVLSLDSLKALGAGPATKFVIPFEITKLLEGASDYVGYSRNAGDRQLSEIKDVEKAIGKADDILGTIPTAEEMADVINAIKEEVEEAAQAVASEGIKDEYSGTEPTREI
jgi:hypothetical protein